MVCLPCIVLPVALWIYVRFIQPLIFRLMPESWRAKLDAVLYPTCPARVPGAADKAKQEEGAPAVPDDCCAKEHGGGGAQADTPTDAGSKKDD